MSKKTHKNKKYRNKGYRNKRYRNKTHRNKKYRNKKYRNKKYRKMTGGNIIDTTVIDTHNYNIMLYTDLPENIKNEAKYMCSNMFSDTSDEDTADLVDDMMTSGTNNIYIFQNDTTNEIVSFIIMRNNLCETDCFNCNKSCSYILLTCVKQDKRGQRIFAYFLTAVEKYLRHEMIECIRLTALNPNVFKVYSKLGFITENPINKTCQYKMIKYL